jgi:hypothetical protein
VARARVLAAQGIGGAGPEGPAAGPRGDPDVIMALHAWVVMGYEESIRGAGAPAALDADARQDAGAAVRGRRIKGP